MKKELALKLAYEQVNNGKMIEVMEKANEIFKSNSTDWNTPFAPVDIVFAKFVEYAKENCSQREIDLITISENLNRVWTTLHIHMKLMKQEPNYYQKENISITVAALKRLELVNLLTEDLPKEIVKWLETDLTKRPKKNSKLK